jgi:hypothetical protein
MIFEYGKYSITFTQEPIMKDLRSIICCAVLLAALPVSAQLSSLDRLQRTWAIEDQTRTIERQTRVFREANERARADAYRAELKRSSDAQRLRQAIKDAGVKRSDGWELVPTPSTPRARRTVSPEEAARQRKRLAEREREREEARRFANSPEGREKAEEDRRLAEKERYIKMRQQQIWQQRQWRMQNRRYQPANLYPQSRQTYGGFLRGL